MGAIIVALAVSIFGSPAQAARETPPQVPSVDRGATIDDVSVESYGLTNPEVAMRYLSLHVSDVLSQSAVDRDYSNLAVMAGLRTRLEIRHHPRSAGVSLHWIVLAKFFQTTDHPLYGDQPLTIPIQGFGFVISSRPLDKSGATVSSYTQIALRAQLIRVVYTKPLWVDPARGREGDLIVDTYGARGDFRATQPVTQDIYSFLSGNEVVYLDRGTNGTQVEFGIRNTRSTSAKPTYITAPSFLDTYYVPSRNTTLEAGLSPPLPRRADAVVSATLLFAVSARSVRFDWRSRANTRYRSGYADVAQYTRVGSSTLAFRAAANRTGGVIPTSSLPCAFTAGYAKGTCGTDTNLLQGEFRIADARPGPLKFILFTETAASRIRGGDQPFARPNFQWRADSGAGIMYRGFRFNVAYGNQGGRITYQVLGQLF